MMPNKTIYVSEADAPLFDRAQELAGGNLSAAIAAALRRYVESEETPEAGEIIVKVGEHGAYRQQRFTGRQVGKLYLPDPDSGRAIIYRVYLTNKGNFAVYVKDVPNWAQMGRRNGSDHAGWKHFSGDWWHPTAHLEVYPSLAEMEAHIPPALFAAITASLNENEIEDLDI